MISDLIMRILTDIQPGRLVESLIFLAVLLWRIQPHLKKIENRMKGLEDGLKSIKDSMSLGFTHGNIRFSKIENRLEMLERCAEYKLKMGESKDAKID